MLHRVSGPKRKYVCCPHHLLVLQVAVLRLPSFRAQFQFVAGMHLKSVNKIPCGHLNVERVNQKGSSHVALNTCK